MPRAVPSGAAPDGSRVRGTGAAEDRATSPEAIRDAVEEILSTMKGDLTASHANVSAQLRGLAQYIEATRVELGRLRSRDITEHHIPSATDELDTVVKETEDATNAIMHAAEGIAAITGALEGQTQARLSDAVTKIYEACSFQDITGQRIRKVVRALKEIEARVSDMVVALDGNSAEGPKRETSTATEKGSADSGLLHGPQLPGGAISQNDIDTLFAKTD